MAKYSSWCIGRPLDQVVEVQALVGVIVLCSWAQEYKWVLANLVLDMSTPSRGVGIVFS